jgi:hypothetical protein
VKEVGFWMKNNKETGCDDIPAEVGCWLRKIKKLKHSRNCLVFLKLKRIFKRRKKCTITTNSYGEGKSKKVRYLQRNFTTTSFGENVLRNISV